VASRVCLEHLEGEREQLQLEIDAIAKRLDDLNYEIKVARIKQASTAELLGHMARRIVDRHAARSVRNN
jgi:hypothetical protein